MAGLSRLPDRLHAFLADSRYTFVGRAVAADVKKISKDFSAATLAVHVRCEDLGVMARKRGVVNSGTAGLEKLVEMTLQKRLSKAPAVRLSKWSRMPLSSEQEEYAALDAILSLEVYCRLQKMPDLAARLSPDEAVVGTEADLVPMHGSVGVMATHAAVVTIKATSGRWAAPHGMLPAALPVSTSRRLVTVTSVLASNFIVPSLKKTGALAGSVCLKDFGAVPFDLVVSVRSLAPHVPTRTSAAQDGSDDERSSDDGSQGDSPISRARRAQRPASRGDDTEGSGDDDDESVEDDYEFWDRTGADLHANDVELVRAAQAAATAAATPNVDVHLDPPPAQIDDVFSCVLGDAFHFMDRPKVPVHHDTKKAYFVALRDAWFVFDAAKLEDARRVLRQKGKSDTDIEAMMYYSFSYFRERVPRIVPPPSVHYHRVRAVFELFGPKVDAETGKSLFNVTAWKKANNVLKEILAGYAADGPFSFYTQRLNSRGEPAVDADGIALLDCNRGTNDTESVHKHLVTTWGTWCVGIELSDCLLREWRHRFNQGVSERRRLGFPKLGHYDTWLVDALQILVEQNHGKLLYPEWCNASDYVATAESFGAVPLHSADLGRAIAAISVDWAAKDASGKPLVHLTPDQRYLCKATGVQLPCLPVHGEAECRLFARLVLEQQQASGTAPDFDAMARARGSPSLDRSPHSRFTHVWPFIGAQMVHFCGRNINLPEAARIPPHSRCSVRRRFPRFLNKRFSEILRDSPRFSEGSQPSYSSKLAKVT